MFASSNVLPLSFAVCRHSAKKNVGEVACSIIITISEFMAYSWILYVMARLVWYLCCAITDAMQNNASVKYWSPNLR